ncbi:MAG: diguanylate cyclase [Bacillota bacterium]|nr:diguanylate cyclase [Bacillota bacterium]
MKHSILILDDSNFNLEILKRQLGSIFNVITATDANQGIKIAVEKKPSLILLDVMMPKINGYEVCKIIKSYDDTKNIPVVFLTSRSEIEDKVEGLEVGGDDYITKPYNVSELIARINVHIRLKEAQDKFRQLLEEKNQLIEQLEKLSLHDGLTGVYNRKYLESYLEKSFEGCGRYGLDLSVIITDIDYYKRVNDTYGHQVGDEVLKRFVDRISANIRKADVLARYGGEEFVIISKNTGIEGAAALAEKLREAIQEKPFQVEEYSINLTASFGIAALSRGNYTSPAQLIRDADMCLYRAKNSGRNRVEY